MRAKRSEEVKELETTVVHLKDKNKQLERQNKEYAKSLQHLQEEMLSLKTQLQQNLAVSKQQQQQSSSEMHQVRVDKECAAGVWHRLENISDLR